MKILIAVLFISLSAFSVEKDQSYNSTIALKAVGKKSLRTSSLNELKKTIRENPDLQSVDIFGKNGVQRQDGKRSRGLRWKPVLDIEAINEIVKIKNLKTVKVWHGSLTEKQISTLKASHPKLKVFDNMSKF